MSDRRLIYAVDDELSIREVYRYAIGGAGFDIQCFENGEGLFTAINAQLPDLVLLDIMLDGADGYELLSALRRNPLTADIPVIMVSAKGEEIDKVRGLDLGADDYIPKPFRPRELLSRIKNVLRLTGSTGKTVKLGDVVVDTEKGTAMKNNKDLFLSALEYRLLLTFINNRGIVLTRERLLDSMWDVAGTYVNDNTLTVYIKRLREKIEDDPAEPKIIQTVRGIGYKVDA